MERRVLFENIEQQAVRHEPINLHARLDAFFQAHGPFKDDEGADLAAGHNGSCTGDGVDHLVQLFFVDFPGLPEQTAAADLFQGTAQFGLEHDGQGDHDHGHGLFQQPVDDVEIQGLADQHDERQDQQSLDQGGGPGVFQHRIDFIEEVGDDHDIHHIEDPDGTNQPL